MIDENHYLYAFVYDHVRYKILKIGLNAKGSLEFSEIVN